MNPRRGNSHRLSAAPLPRSRCVSARSVPASPSSPGAVFLSYASQDAEAAKRICETLRAAGVEVWFDQNELVGGDAWDQKIRGQIKACALFVPIISAETQARREGYFRLEWKLAAQRTHAIADGTAFILPIVIDAMRDGEALVPEEFRSVQWTRLAAGETTPAFVARVKNLLADPTPNATAKNSERAVTQTSASPGTAKSGFPVAIVAPLAVVVLGLIAFIALRPLAKPIDETKPTPPASAAPTPPVNEKSIAVLLFKNQSAEKENAFFTDGIHDDILTNLAHVRELRVVSSTTVEQYRDSKKTIRQIGAELGVTWVLEGSVQRAGSRIRMNAQLINARTDEHAWAETFDRDLSDIFVIQSELAQKITASLKAVLSPDEKQQLERRPTENLAAYDLYLKGMADGPSTVVRDNYYYSEHMMQAAVDLDPKFVDAWGALLRAQSFIYRNYEQTEARLAACQVSYATLMRLAPDSRAAILSGARYYLWCLGDFGRAIEQTERFIQLQPNDPEGYFLLEVIQFRQARLPEAIANLRKSIALEPANRGYRINLIGSLNGARRYEEVVQEYQSILKYWPDSPGVPAQLALAIFRSRGSTREMDALLAAQPADVANSPDGLTQRADWAASRGDVNEFIRLDELRPAATGDARITRILNLAAALAAGGDLAKARAQLAPLETEALQRAEKNPTNQVAWRTAGAVAAVLGHAEAAMRCVEKLRDLPDTRLTGALTAAADTANLAFVYTWLGDKPRAIEEYAKLFLLPFGNLSVHEMRHHPRYAPLRGDPKFEALLTDPKNNAPLF